MNAIEKLGEFAEAVRWGGECRILHEYHKDFGGECSDRECGECRAVYLRAVADEIERDRADSPKVLDADGKPIEVGKVYYGKSDGAAWLVEGINANNKSHPIVARNASKGAKELRPEWLTLEPPDTWERLYLDMGNGRMTVGEFERRCKALAEREAR